MPFSWITVKVLAEVAFPVRLPSQENVPLGMLRPCGESLSGDQHHDKDEGSKRRGMPLVRLCLRSTSKTLINMALG